MKSNSLALQGVVVAREGATLTPPITCRVEAGEMLVIKGLNGSGKSTLLKTLAGLLRPEAGHSTWNDAPLQPGAFVYLGHKLGLCKEMSVFDNVALWANLSGAPELTAAALHYFELADIADVAVSTLSAGWQQRVALTRLITIQAKLWLLDEPTSNLDSDGILLLQNLIQSRMEQGGVVLVATHASLGGERIKTININKLN